MNNILWRTKKQQRKGQLNLSSHPTGDKHSKGQTRQQTGGKNTTNADSIEEMAQHIDQQLNEESKDMDALTEEKIDELITKQLDKIKTLLRVFTAYQTLLEDLDISDSDSESDTNGI